MPADTAWQGVETKTRREETEPCTSHVAVKSRFVRMMSVYKKGPIRFGVSYVSCCKDGVAFVE